MNLMKITAIVDQLLLDNIQAALESHGVSGFSIQPVKGRGKYCNTYSKDHLVEHIQIDIFVPANDAHKIAQLILNTADVGTDSEGLVAIIPVDTLYWVKDQMSARPEDFNYLS